MNRLEGSKCGIFSTSCQKTSFSGLPDIWRSARNLSYRANFVAGNSGSRQPPEHKGHDAALENRLEEFRFTGRVTGTGLLSMSTPFVEEMI
jgi:hypothetical protein